MAMPWMTTRRDGNEIRNEGTSVQVHIRQALVRIGSTQQDTQEQAGALRQGQLAVKTVLPGLIRVTDIKITIRTRLGEREMIGIDDLDP